MLSLRNSPKLVQNGPESRFTATSRASNPPRWLTGRCRWIADSAPKPPTLRGYQSIVAHARQVGCKLALSGVLLIEGRQECCVALDKEGGNLAILGSLDVAYKVIEPLRILSHRQRDGY